MSEVIQFKKQRELGAILTDTFKFIRLQFKPLFGTILKKAGPALLVLVLAFVYYIQSFGRLNEYGGADEFGIQMLLAIGIMLLAGMVFYTLMYLSVIAYVKSYVKNNGVALPEEINTEIRERFWSVIGLSFLIGLMIGFGLVVCFFPGIYLGVVLVPAYCIHIIGKRDVMDSISYSFELIKGEWWITFATFLVAGIIYYVVVIIAQVPQYIYFFIRTFTIAEQVGADPTDLFDWGYTILSSLGMIVQYLMQVLIVLTSIFIYYNLNEKKNYTGTLEAIESLGSDQENE